MKILRVGDPHVKPTNIRESEALLNFILDTARFWKVDRLEILGDLFDTHSIVRIEVLEFWNKWLEILSIENFKTIVLVGNHDQSGDYNSTFSALSVFKMIEHNQDRIDMGLKIVDEPYVNGVYGYLPYIHSNDKFVEEANKLAEKGATILVSHPNYEGAVYDNGSPIQAGVDPNRLDSRFHKLIGGHIHTELEIGRVWYTGNPRWLTKSCANKQKRIWLCIHDENGALISKEPIGTESVCTPIVSIKWLEGQEKPSIPENAKVDIELVGSSDWVSKTKKDLIGVSVSSKITDTKKSRERKSGRSLHEFLSNHYAAEPEKRQKLIKYMEGLSLVG